ncbi:hypothetical protein AB3N58_05480 [Leptospira sp. WS60.C2]
MTKSFKVTLHTNLSLKLIFLSVIFLNASLQAESVLQLKNGSMLKGLIQQQDESHITIKTEDGNVRRISKEQILKISFKNAKPKEKILNQTNLPLEDNVLPERLPSEETEKPSELISLEIINNVSDAPLTLATPADKCEEFNRLSYWYWMFGTLPLSSVDTSQLLPKEKKKIRIRWIATKSDLVITFFSAILTSVTRKTLLVEVCETDKNRPESNLKPKAY